MYIGSTKIDSFGMIVGAREQNILIKEIAPRLKFNLEKQLPDIEVTEYCQSQQSEALYFKTVQRGSGVRGASFSIRNHTAKSTTDFEFHLSDYERETDLIVAVVTALNEFYQALAEPAITSVAMDAAKSKSQTSLDLFLHQTFRLGVAQAIDSFLVTYNKVSGSSEATHLVLSLLELYTEGLLATDNEKVKWRAKWHVPEHYPQAVNIGRCEFFISGFNANQPLFYAVYNRNIIRFYADPTVILMLDND